MLSSAIPWFTGAVNCYFRGLPAQSTAMDYLLCCQPLFPLPTICAVNSDYLMVYLYCQQLFQWSTCVGNTASMVYLCCQSLFQMVYCYFHGLHLLATAISMVYLCTLLSFSWSTSDVNCYFHGLPVQSTAIFMVYLCRLLLLSWSTCPVNH